MSKILVLLAMLVCSCVVILSVAADDFESFKSQFKKSYSASENKRRKAIFQSNLAQIEKLNKLGNSETDAKFGINHLIDMDAAEFKKTRLGLATPTKAQLKSDSALRGANNNQPALNASTNYPVDGTFTWESISGRITPVKDQGNCGSCWIFAAISTIETSYAIKTNKLTSFSEQQLLNCPPSGYSNSCNGGWPEDVYKDAIKNGVVASTTYYGSKKTCSRSLKVITKVSKYARVTNQKSEQDIINALRNYGTLVMCLNANKIGAYKTGIISAAQCGTGGPNHAVTLVGYGTESGKKYWRFRNSWGATWGDKGYFRVERNKNACDIENPYTGYGPWYVIV